MIINHNMNAMNAQRNMSTNTVNAGKSMEKLSSGLRINKAGDDAAGLAISEKMRGQIRGLDQASRNSQDAISLIQTAEGSLNETHSILQRMRELAVQSSNDTNVNVDREAIQDEFDQLTKEISRIGENTEFNTQKLLDGSFDGTFHIGANEGQSLNLSISDMRANSLGVVGNAKITQTATITAGADTTGTASITGTTADGTYTIEGTNLKNSQGTIVATTADGGLNWTGNDAGALGDDKITFEQKVDTGTITILNGSVSGTAEIATDLEAGDYTIDQSAKQLLDAGGNVVATSTDNKTFISAKDGSTTLLTLDAAAGADRTLSVGGIDVSTQANADNAITTINNALETVSSERAKLGSYQNRLEHTIANLGTSSENLQSAESRIRDVDMAKEMMTFSKNNILSQAAQAMLAQANQQPQGVLQLLR